MRFFSYLIIGILCISFCISTKTVAAPLESKTQAIDWDDSELGSKEQISISIEKLKKQSGADSSAVHFAQGVLNYHQKQFVEAVAQFQETLKDTNSPLKEYAHYFLGLSYRGLDQLPEAFQQFSEITKIKGISPRKLGAQFHLGEIAYLQKNYKFSELQIKGLERKVRNTIKYPFVLWYLAKLNLTKKNIYQTCFYVRKLYSRYPAHPLISHWNIFLKDAEIDGAKPGCYASLNEQKQRIRNLQYSGESFRAKAEIQSLYEKSNAFTKYDTDLIQARYLIDEGEVEEAFKTLLPYYEEKSGDVSYLMLMAKAASIRGDSPLAISAYLKVQRMNPKSRVAREAFFQAAYASYLNQDYDGALQRFTEYQKRYGGGNGQISLWYVAWIRYLRGDYKEAYDMMNRFSHMRVSRKVRNLVFDSQKIAYWKSICLFKMGQVDLAKKQLEKIAQDPSMGYYTIAAKARLVAMASITQDKKIPNIADKKSKKMETSMVPTVLSAENIISGTVTQDRDVASDAGSTEEEILSDSKTDLDSEEPADSVGEEGDEKVEEGAVAETPTEEVGDIFSNFKDPRLQAVFQRAEILRQMGLDDWANRELQYIEAHTRNKTYLQNLIDKYEQGGVYSRSSYIAEVYYSNERRKSFVASNPGWGKAFPQAFNKFIEKYADSYSVPTSLMWGIMRTESFFKPYAHSNVGAIGLMQVMPLTAQKMAEQLEIKNFQVSQLFEPETNIKVGGKYIQRLSKMFDNSIPLVAAGYNAGPHRVYTWLKNFGKIPLDEFIEHIPYNQTRGYVKKVLRSYYVYDSLYFPEDLKKKPIQWLAEPAQITYNGPIPTKETWESF